MDDHFDVFISHASEDKDDFVGPLVGALQDRGLTVWFDAHQIKLGDDFRRKMDDGLARSDFGVVVLSPSFSKYWTEAELSALFNQERVFDEKRILPVLHQTSHADVTRKWPLVAARASAHSSAGVDEVADEIMRTMPADRTPSSSSRLVGVPQPTQVFVGRAPQLRRLEDMLRGPSSVALAASVEGLAGIGKTELAIQLTHRLANTSAFPGGIYWIPAEQADLTTVWGTTVADALGEADGTPAERAGSVIRNLSRRTVPTLIVLDNVEHWSKERKPQPLPEGSHIRQLVTTRRRELGGQWFRHVEVDFLTDDEARQLLLAIAGPEIADAPGFEDLLEHLGGHALGLEIAGAYLSEFTGEAPGTYLKALKERAEADEAVLERVGYGRTAEHALETVWQRLDETTQDAWLLAARFAPEIVQPELSEAAGLTAKPLGDLRRFHLVELDSDGAWRMHRLVRDFARSRSEVASRIEKAAEALVEGCDRVLRAQQVHGDPRPFLVHLAHLDRAAAEEVQPEMMSMFLSGLEGLMQTVGDLDRSRQLSERALALAIEAHGESHRTVAAFRSNLATVLQAQGDLPGAQTLLEQALAVSLKELGESHPMVAAFRTNLAAVLKAQGDLAGARTLLEQALAVYREAHGESHPTMAITRSHLALVLKAQGDLAGARTLLEQALAVDFEVYGASHPVVARTRSNLATVLKAQGDLPGAQTLLEQALAVDLEVYGDSHPTVATHRTNLATVLKARGDLPGARTLLEQALAVFASVLGEKHRNTKMVLRGLKVILNESRGQS